MAKLKNTTKGRLAQYTPQVLELIEKSMTSGLELTFNIGKRTPIYRIKDTRDNRTTLNKYQQLALTQVNEEAALALELKTVHGDDGFVNFGQLSKDLIRGVKFNKGNVSEGILAAAITARFKHKNKDIETKHVYEVIKKFEPVQIARKQKVDVEFSSPNENPEVNDTVRCLVSLAPSNMKALVDTNIVKSLDDYVKGAVVYANGLAISGWANELYKNNRPDKIEVDADGLVDEKGTKVDLRVKINDTIKAVNISLKAGDVKQFGQVSGSKYENMIEMFDPLLDMKLKNDTSLTKKHNALLNKSDTVGATILIYETVKDRITTQISNGLPGFLDKLSKFILFHATRNEDNVDMLQLNKQDAKLYSFDNTIKIIGRMELDVGIKSSHSKLAGTDISRLVIKMKGANINDSKNTLLTIRMKLDSRTDGFYHRNYIEKGELMDSLTTEI